MNSLKTKISKGAYAMLVASVIYVTVLVAATAIANEHDEKGQGHAHERGSESRRGEQAHEHSSQLEAGKSRHEHGSHEEGEASHAQREKGFQLSAEAFRNFGIQLLKVESGVPLKLARKSIFFGLEERNLYRYRDGFFKRVDFKMLSKTKTEFTVTSDDLVSGDEIAVEGLGFLRIAELAAFGGVAEGHSH